MSPIVGNLIAKNATIKIGTYGQAEGAALDVGALEGGVSVEMPREYYDVKADPWLGIVDSVKVGEQMIIKCSMAEITLANLAVAFDYPASAVAGQTFSFGGDDTSEKRTIYINGNGPSGGTRKITLHKCIVRGNAAHAYKKGDKTMVEIEIHVLQDTSKSANQQYGTVVDTGSDTTAPTVALTTPVDGGTVTKATQAPVIWTITDAGVMDEGSIIYGDTFQIINTTNPASAALEPGSIVYDATAKTVTFTPTGNWNASDTFQAIVSTGLKDIAGNNLATPKIEQFSVTA